jgi:hypothetical protein
MMTRASRLSLNSAEFNHREIAKQLLLLEDHLTDDKKFCSDCIRKHLMLVEAFAEEAMMLEPTGSLMTKSKLLQRQAKRWIMNYEDGLDRFELAKSIRRVRKSLVKYLYDPRSVS